MGSDLSSLAPLVNSGDELQNKADEAYLRAKEKLDSMSQELRRGTEGAGISMGAQHGPGGGYRDQRWSQRAIPGKPSSSQNGSNGTRSAASAAVAGGGVVGPGGGVGPGGYSSRQSHFEPMPPHATSEGGGQEPMRFQPDDQASRGSCDQPVFSSGAWALTTGSLTRE